MRKHIAKFITLFVLTIVAIWIFVPAIYPKSSEICDTVSSRAQVAAYNTFISCASAQTDGCSMAAITFDDGFESIYTNAYPILNDYGYAASIAVIGNRIGEYQYLSYKQLSILYRKGYEIVNHSYRHIQKDDFSDNKMINDFKTNRILLKAAGFTKGSNIIITPGGLFSDRYMSVANKSNFKAIRTLKNLYLVKENKRADVRIINIYGSRPMENILSEINKAYNANQNIILIFHRVEDSPPKSDMYVSTQSFTEIINYISTKNFDVISYERLITNEINNH